MKTTSCEYEKLLAGLVRAEVRFITVGGLACAMCGFVRATEDVDIIVDAAVENIKRLIAFLSAWGEGCAAELQPDDFTDEEGALRVVEEFPLDIFVRMSGLRYHDLLPYCREHDAGAARIPYLNPAGLLRLKQNSRRDKDRIDASVLRRLLEASAESGP